jgi:hypothetical protein
MSKHPYQTQPPFAFWRRAISEVPCKTVDPVVSAAFTLSSTDKVATAGSCFAQHISRHLSAIGFNFYVTEDAHPIVRDVVKTDYNYGVYTARYGNIYTSRQLLQLFRRAYKQFFPADDVWKRSDNRFVDPFRPQICPEGYFSDDELRADREHHLTCVRKAFENLDVFIFTLGLTETWYSKQDGAVFPICPGVAGGAYDESRYGFVNLRVADVVADMGSFITLLRGVNPTARVLLTVSPVPLIATAENRHVLVSTTYSKSALRAACEDITAEHENAFYFPSYEIITGSFSRGRYYAANARDVTEEGVEHVMNLFMKYYVGASGPAAVTVPTTSANPDADFERVVRVICDEEALAR